MNTTKPADVGGAVGSSDAAPKRVGTAHGAGRHRSEKPRRQQQEHAALRRVVVRRGDRLGRREVARMLQVHPDSVTRRLSSGLGAAVIDFGGRGKHMIFFRPAFQRWAAAQRCVSDKGRPCRNCAAVLEDCEHVARHLRDIGHGYGSCWYCAPHEHLLFPCALRPGDQRPEVQDRLVTTVELAMLFGVHVATIRAWVGQGMPVAQPGNDFDEEPAAQRRRKA